MLKKGSESMHILIVPSEIFTTDFFPIGAIFQKDQAVALSEGGLSVGVLSVGYLPLNMLLKRNKYNKIIHTSEQNVNVIRHYIKKILPFKFMPFFWREYQYVRLGLKAFEFYKSLFGLPHLIHAHNCFYGSLIALAIQKKYGLPFIVTEHSSQFFTTLTKVEKNKVNLIFSKCEKFITVSNKLMNNVKAFLSVNIDEGKLANIPNILDPSFSNINLSSFKTRKKFTFLNIANLIDLKNHKQLIDAFARTFSDIDNVQLCIGGKGPNLENLKTQVEKLGISKKVNFLGYLSRFEVINAMNECHIFVLPSFYETFGVVLIEALACGKPIIATACGGPEDIVEEGNGILVAVNNTDALAKAMHYMYINSDKFDPVLIRRECLLKFGEKAVAQQLLQIYRSILYKNK